MRRCAVPLILLLIFLCRSGEGGVPERFELASEPIPTPHVAWAKPLAGGPLRTLCLIPIPAQRDVVELAQRLDVQYDLISFQSPLLHAADAEQFRKLLADKPYDLILLSKVPLAKLPEETQTLLVDKVRQGAGLLNVHSAATPPTGEAINVSGSGEFLELGLPLDLLPQGCRPEIRVGRLGRGRSVSLRYSASVACLTPRVDSEQVNYRDWEAYFQVLCRAALWAAGRDPGVQVETVWPSTTVHRQPADSWRTEELLLRLRSAADGPATVTATHRGPDYYDPIGQQQQAITLRKAGPVEVRFPLLSRCGGQDHAVDLVVRDAQGRSLAFATATYEVVSPVALSSWAADKEFYPPGDEVRIVAKFENQSGPREVKLEVRLSDMHGRLIAAEEEKLLLPAGRSERSVTLPTDNSLTTLNLARLRVDDAQGELLRGDAYVYLPKARPTWDDYLVSTSQFSSTSAYLRPYAVRLAREMGIEGLVIPLSYSLETLQQAAPVMYWGVADIHAFGYNFHGEETSTARRPCLSDPATRGKITEAYEKVGTALRRYGPMALASLEDESELSGARYSNLEVCTSEHCTRRYRDWLKAQYRTIESLNREWDTSYASFDQIERLTYEEARKRANPAPWIDWRTFMEHVWLDGLLLTRAGVKKHYPEVRMGFSNTFGQMPFSGWNYETLSRHVDMTIEYPTGIFQLTPPKTKDAFEDDQLPMSVAIRQKLDIRRSFMPDDAPSPGWLWYDRSQQGAEFKPWWMAFLGAKGCTPWGPDSLGVLPGAKQMAFWAFVHPQLAHTKSSKWLASSLEDLTHGVGKVFVDYQRATAPVAVLYSQPSMHLAWAWSDVQSAFNPEITSLYAWYYKSRVNVTRMLRELGLTYRYVGAAQIEAGALSQYRVLVLPCSLCLSEATLEQLGRFVEAGGTVVADLGAGAADEHGRPAPRRPSVERLFGVSRQAVGRKIEPGSLAVSAPSALPLPSGLKLAGKDAITAAAGAAAIHQDQTPALVVHTIGRGKTVYLNGMLGYNMPSRLLLRALLASAGVSTPVRIISGGSEHMGYECTTFRRGELEVLGILRLRDETTLTEIKLDRPSHLYDVRNKRYLGRTETARLDMTKKAAAVLALLPYQVVGVEARAAPGQTAPGQPVTITAQVRATANPGDHVLRMEVCDPTGRRHRAYTRNLLAVGGRIERVLHTALNDQPGRWRVRVCEVFSGQKAEAEFRLAPSANRAEEQ